MAKESKLLQELGPKKYYKKVEDANKFYDKYKAGKRDPKTGEVFRDISYSNPNKQTNLGRPLGCIECLSCNEPLNVKTSTVSIICGRCRCMHRIEHNREDNTFTVEAVNLNKGTDNEPTES